MFYTLPMIGIKLTSKIWIMLFCSLLYCVMVNCNFFLLFYSCQLWSQLNTYQPIRIIREINAIMFYNLLYLTVLRFGVLLAVIQPTIRIVSVCITSDIRCSILFCFILVCLIILCLVLNFDIKKAYATYYTDRQQIYSC